MNLRPAALSDALQMAEIHAASWRFAYRGAISDEYLAGDVVADRHKDWLKRLGDPRPHQYVVVAEEAGEIAGFACVYAHDSSEWGSLIDCIHVKQSQHGKGIGTRIMRDVAAWCESVAPDAPLYLWVLKSNQKAQSFYLNLGATHVGQDLWTSPSGGAAPVLRYSWQHPKHLCDSCV